MENIELMIALQIIALIVLIGAGIPAYIGMFEKDYRVPRKFVAGAITACVLIMRLTWNVAMWNMAQGNI